jgi:hypothetical protein
VSQATRGKETASQRRRGVLGVWDHRWEVATGLLLGDAMARVLAGDET